MNTWEKIKECKEGIFIGAVAGAIAGFFLFPDTVNMSGIANSYGMIDLLKPVFGVASLTWAKYKAIFACVFIGATVGGIIDYMLPEGWLKRR